MRSIQIIDGLLYCSKCELNKPVSEFYWFKNRPKRPCKQCKNDYQQTYYTSNKEKINPREQEHYQQNRDKLLEQSKFYYQENKEKISVYQAEYRQTNKIQLNEKRGIYTKTRLLNDPAFKLRKLVSNAIFQALKINGSGKGGKSILQYLPNSIIEIQKHLEFQFKDWMTWENWGIYNSATWDEQDQTTWTWQIDHIKPQIALPFQSLEDDNFKKCWSVNNLRPLSAKENNIKGDKYVE